MSIGDPQELLDQV